MQCGVVSNLGHTQGRATHYGCLEGQVSSFLGHTWGPHDTGSQVIFVLLLQFGYPGDGNQSFHTQTKTFMQPKRSCSG